jgi:hypothetical protein
LKPETICNDTKCGESVAKVPGGKRFVTDEPSVVYPSYGGPNSVQLQKHFIDFVMCGTEIKDVLQWTRTGIGAQPCQGSKDPQPRVMSSNYAVATSTDVKAITDQVCSAETPIEGASARADASYLAIRSYLNCRN